MTEIRKFRGISANSIKLQAFSRILKKYWEFLRFTLLPRIRGNHFAREKKACLQLLYKLSNTLVELCTKDFHRPCLDLFAFH